MALPRNNVHLLKTQGLKTHAISTSFMNSENLNSRMEEKLILTHNQVTRFTRESAFMIVFLFVAIAIFLKIILHIQSMAI
jgi:hypothetical protein